MNILVVGATGGTGRQTVTELSERGHHVTAFARQTRLLGSDAGAPASSTVTRPIPTPSLAPSRARMPSS